MSVYFVKGKGKGWRCDFRHKGIRYTEAWFKTKKEANAAEARRKEELKNPTPQTEMLETPTDMAFLALIHKRLDYLKDHKTKSYYNDTFYMARRWTNLWSSMYCGEILEYMINGFLRERKKGVSVYCERGYQSVKGAFQLWEENKIIIVNPVD